MSKVDPLNPPNDESTVAGLLNLPVDWEEHIEQKERDAALHYMLSMTPVERLRRNDEACRVIARLEAVAERYGLKSVRWMIRGPKKTKGTSTDGAGVRG